jgi:hypothetical protein
LKKQIDSLEKQATKKKWANEAKQRALEKISLTQEIAAYHNEEKGKKKDEVRDKLVASTKEKDKLFRKREVTRHQRNESAHQLRSRSQVIMREDQTVRKMIQ